MSKNSIENCNKLAEELGGKCISTEYKNATTAMLWLCMFNHILEKTFTAFQKKGLYCNICEVNQGVTFNDCINLAIENEGECLSTEMKLVIDKLKWRCKKNHVFENSYRKTLMRWCPDCSREEGYTIKKCQMAALKMGGKCLSIVYENSKTQMSWECKNSHLFEAAVNNVFNGNWCPYCAKNAPVTIEDCKRIAIEKGGKCLSTEYKRTQDNLLWECELGHTWEACYQHIKVSRSWCAVCNGKHKLTIEECHSIAKKRGGECLETIYNNSDELMSWKCKNNHIWKASFTAIKHKCSWCLQCTKLTIEECHEYAKKNNGKCLSSEYIDAEKPMEWECDKQHLFVTSFQSIKYWNTWCNVCTSWRSETCAKEIIEKILKVKLLKSRPEFLRYMNPYCPKHDDMKLNCGCKLILSKMEFDGYNKQHSIAFEYQGEQHIKKNKRYHKSDLQFYSYIRRDVIKELLSKFNNVKIIYIPHTFSFKNLDEMGIFIQKEIERLNIS